MLRMRAIALCAHNVCSVNHDDPHILNFFYPDVPFLRMMPFVTLFLTMIPLSPYSFTNLTSFLLNKKCIFLYSPET